MIGRLWRYLFIQTLIGLIGAAVIITAVILLIDFVETARDIGTRVGISAFQALHLSLLKAPLLVQDTLPFIVLFGVLFTFFRLNRRSELIVMRASGYSAWRILAPVAILAALTGAISTLALNPLGAASNARFEATREALFEGEGQSSGANQSGPIWLRETTATGYIMITAQQQGGDDATLTEPVFRQYVLSESGAPLLDRRITAERAELNGGFWSLTNAIEYAPGGQATELGDVALPTNVGRQALFERARSPGAVSFWQLPAVIASARDAGLSSLAYELRWHGLLAQPLMLVAAALMGIAATLRLHRLGGAAGFAAAGATAGFILYFSQELMLGLGASGAITPLTAAWTTPALFSLAGLFFIAATEDG